MNDKQPPQENPRQSAQRDREERIKTIFKAQFRHLSALFPKDGDTMVSRACAAAIQASRASHLRGAHPDAIAEKVIAAHHLGVEIGDQASLVPFKDDLQLIIGPRGLIALAYRSGFVKSIVARSVFEADVADGLFDYDLGDNPFIRHKKAMDRRRGHITHAYCVVETTTEGKIREVLTYEDLEFYRSFSKAKTGPWFENFEGMARKTVIKRALEFVPRSPVLAAALRENETGGFEITDDIMAIIRGKLDADTAQPEREIVYDQVTGEVPARQPEPA